MAERGPGRLFASLRDAAERVLETERAQLALWTPVALGGGIIAWFVLPTRADWMAFLCLCLGAALALLVGAAGRGRLARSLGMAALLAGAGCVLIWGKALWVAAPVLTRPALVETDVRVLAVEDLRARVMRRLLVRPEGRDDLPRRIRVTLADPPSGIRPPIRPGQRLHIRARLMPPAPPALPGGYDYARRAWFEGLGATGKLLSWTALDTQSGGAAEPGVRERLSAHVAAAVPGPPGAIAVTLATGDQGGISAADADAMRASGLAHLLSISGVHVTAVVGVVMVLTLRLLSLSTRLALRWPLVLASATAGALAGVGYTLLTGAEVPTIRSCISAVLVMGALALGREAISLRLLAAGALFVLCLWPESVIGPSFQLSFAAVATIVSLHEHPRIRRLLAHRDEARWIRGLRVTGGLLLTGLAVEAALAPIALYHFHKTGMLAAFANIIAIPLTELVIMPAEGLALVLDLAGLGAPAWWVVGKALALLLALAHAVAAHTEAMLLLPAIPWPAFAIAVLGLLWLLLWRSRLRWAGVPLLAAGLVGYALAPLPDVLVSRDGHHVAVRTDSGGLALLRAGAGDYMRDALSEQAAFAGAPSDLTTLPAVRCSADFCRATVTRDARPYVLLLARSRDTVPWRALVTACTAADIVIAERRLPRGCMPRWLKLDGPDLRRSGAAALFLSRHIVLRSQDPADEHPWSVAAAPHPFASARPSGVTGNDTAPHRAEDQLYRRSSPASLPWMRTRPAS